MKNNCGCCEGIQALTPQVTANRPGLNALTYRIGTRHSFLQTMLAKLSSNDLPALARLKTRQSDDFAIALLDAWATVADVLTFYQERIANEGYLRTATERRSILELARLVGYQLQPGIAASVHLAFTMDKAFNDDKAFIPAGTQAQSIPQPGELSQIFETEKDETARTDWNKLQPRLIRPHYITSSTVQIVSTLYARGIGTNLTTNDRLLFVFRNNSTPVSRIVRKVEPQVADDRTKIMLLDQQSIATASIPTASIFSEDISSDMSPREGISFEMRAFSYPFAEISVTQIQQLVEPPTVPPANAFRLNRGNALAFNPATDIAPSLLAKLQTTLNKKSLYTAFQNTPVTPPAALDSTEKFAVKAAPFGHNAPLKIVYDDNGRPVGNEEWGMNTLMVNVEWLLDSETGLSNVVIRDQGTTYSGQISRSNNSIVLDNITVVLAEGSDSGESANRSLRYSFTEQGQDTPFKTITISSSTFSGPEIEGVSLASVAFPFNLPEGAPATVGVAIGDNSAINIRSGQQQRFTIGPRTVFLSYQNPAVLVQDTEEKAVRSSQLNRLALDAKYDKIIPNSWVLVERSGDSQVFRVEQVQTVSVVRYGLTGQVTQLVLDDDWITESDRSLSDIREVTVYAQSEPLTLAEEVIDPVAEPIGGGEIALATLYGGLQAGRWLIICGERTDIPNTTGVEACELVMLAAVRQGVDPIPSNLSERGDEPLPFQQDLPGDTTHSFLRLATPLEYTYKRDTVTIYGNVVKATHGETREEVLGSGDGSQKFQSFTLRQPPLTFLSAPTPSGMQSTLEVRVNQVQWHEVDSLGMLGEGDRNFVIRNDNDANTTLTFGDGHRGLRPPTGIENIRAKYRSGIGKAGNVKAEQISLLASRPLGVKEVINPLTSSGGADPESRDQARLNAPLGVRALDRLVSLQDYEDFARTFAGIGKASAVQISDGFRETILLTIAGEDDIPITPTSDLYRNLKQALQQFGSPNRWIQINLRDLMVLIVAAKIRLLPDYRWESVGPMIRTHLLETFSFQQRALAQAVYSSEVLAAIHSVTGVDYVDLNVFSSIAESEVITDPENEEAQESWLDKLENIAQTEMKTPPPPLIEVKRGRISRSAQSQLVPAQLAVLSPEVPDTLKLEALTV